MAQAVSVQRFRTAFIILWVGVINCAFLFRIPAFAIVGNAPPAPGFPIRPIVMVVDAKGDLCTGTAFAADLVLTAAHCVERAVDYQVKTFQTHQSIPVRNALKHPQ